MNEESIKNLLKIGSRKVWKKDKIDITVCKDEIYIVGSNVVKREDYVKLPMLPKIICFRENDKYVAIATGPINSNNQSIIVTESYSFLSCDIRYFKSVRSQEQLYSIGIIMRRYNIGQPEILQLIWKYLLNKI